MCTYFKFVLHHFCHSLWVLLTAGTTHTRYLTLPGFTIQGIAFMESSGSMFFTAEFQNLTGLGNFYAYNGSLTLLQANISHVNGTSYPPLGWPLTIACRESEHELQKS